MQALVGDDNRDNLFGFSWSSGSVVAKGSRQGTYVVQWDNTELEQQWPTAIIQALTADKPPAAGFTSQNGVPACAFALTVASTKGGKKFPFLLDQVRVVLLCVALLTWCCAERHTWTAGCFAWRSGP